MDRQQEFVLRTIEERDIRFVRLWFTDVVGTLKSAVSYTHLDEYKRQVWKGRVAPTRLRLSLSSTASALSPLACSRAMSQ